MIFPVLAIFLIRRSNRYKRELYKQESANRYYEEMLYASPNGYLTYSLYKKREFQYCSRRLATYLALPNGEKSNYSEVFASFVREDSEKLKTNFNTLINNGISFETIVQTPNKKTFMVSGTRINSADSQINSNCLWFRDISKESAYINKVTDESISCRQRVEDFKILIDNLPYPVWLRNDALKITILNRSYLRLIGLKNFQDITPDNITLHDLGNATNLVDLARNAKDSNTPQTKQINILNDGELKKYEITETPHYDSNLKTSHTIGSLIDITGYDEIKRDYQVHLDTHLEILSSLDTAFCIINNKHEFTFGNTAFLKLWNLSSNFLDNAPHYNSFLDHIREQKILPEVSDFKQYKEEENKTFDALTEQKEDLLYIPDGRTFRRLRVPHADGTIIAYEDISDRLTAARRLNDVLSVQKGILNNVSDSILIVSPNLRLNTYNVPYLRLWNIKAQELDKSPYLRELLDMQKPFFPEMEDWDTFREGMFKHITSCTPFILNLKDDKTLSVNSVILADTSLMITYHNA